MDWKVYFFIIVSFIGLIFTIIQTSIINNIKNDIEVVHTQLIDVLNTTQGTESEFTFVLGSLTSQTLEFIVPKGSCLGTIRAVANSDVTSTEVVTIKAKIGTSPNNSNIMSYADSPVIIDGLGFVKLSSSNSVFIPSVNQGLTCSTANQIVYMTLQSDVIMTSQLKVYVNLIFRTIYDYTD